MRRRGFYHPPERTAAGYRTYTPQDVEILVFIRRARALGLHLDDITAILDIRRGGSQPQTSGSYGKLSA